MALRFCVLGSVPLSHMTSVVDRFSWEHFMKIHGCYLCKTRTTAKTLEISHTIYVTERFLPVLEKIRVPTTGFQQRVR